jgi:ligand-binding SRPBCC domain-containing protein
MITPQPIPSPKSPAATARATFDYAFAVRASLAAVADFHHDTHALKRLTPPPLFVQLHRVEPLAEGSVADFTLWFGPLPVRWVAVHSNVDARRGFTDTQQAGPMKAWKHTHQFESVSADLTRVSEHIEYAHYSGWRGLFSRLLFNPLALRLLFFYRGLVTRFTLENNRR